MRLSPLLLIMAATASLAAADVAISIPVGHLRLPTGWTAIAGDDATAINPPSRHPHVELFALPEGTNQAAAAQHIAEIVEPWVSKWKPLGASSSLKVGGADATRMEADGEETDDGDPTSAQVTLFDMAGRTFVLLVHGEGFDLKKPNPELDSLFASIRAN